MALSQDFIGTSQLSITLKAVLRKLMNLVDPAVSGAVTLPNDVQVLTVAGVPVDGTSGTGAGTAGPGSTVHDYTNGNVYVNGGAGTKASPVWKLVTKAV